ncbi:hypothetical protein MNBD_GAMMA09-1577 [hydrothermal vent metagenome]|uniref:Uncharacterized protein n=1 Tax=hydrothermal vent metagenome TaxID=652676 RepID=A0A3B0Y4D3_9ZZZZ
MTENKFLPLYIAAMKMTAMKCRGELRQTKPCLPDAYPDGDEPPTLKQRFLAAVMRGELGSLESQGYIVTLKEFKTYFSDITTQYADSFLPAATIEPGQISMSHTRFLFRLRPGVYLLHSDLIE